MAKKSLSSHQSSLFRREIPHMPEGYYTPGPNPNLRRFVEEHAKPYDPVTDDYNVPPFDQPITTTKATAIYNMHTYWSKKPHDAIRQYIRHYTKPGDLVLDPFSGSGGTTLAALMEGRVGVAIDLSPAATFITSSYLSLPDPSEVRKAQIEIEKEIQGFINDNWIFLETGEYIRSIIYSERFRCSKCFKPVPFILAEEGDTRQFRGRESSKESCPYCGEPINTTKDKRFGFVPVQLIISPSSRSKKTRILDVLDNSKVEKLYPVIPKYIPEHLMVPFEGNIPPRLSKNISKAGVNVVGELFTDINLRTLLEIKKIIDALDTNERVKSILSLALNSIVLNSSRMYRHRTKTAGGGGFSGTYYIPHLSKSMNPWIAFQDKCNEIQEAITEITNQISNIASSAVIVSTESAMEYCSKSHIPENSIDYVFTDPPYGGTYQYGALNFVWEVWNKMDISWRPKEIVISEDGAISFKEWANRMYQALDEIYRVLKPGRWLSLCFHGEVELWAALHDILAEIGFITENNEVTLYLDTTQKSYNQLTGETSKKRDLIINFKKPNIGESGSLILILGDENIETFQDKALSILVDFLDKHSGATADRIYDELISRMVRRGDFQRHNFDELLRSVAEESNGRWYLLETAGQVDEAESKKESGAAKRLERFMIEHLKNAYGDANDLSEGIHYSDLFEQYLPINDKPRRALIEWLPEFFFKTEEGTWRPPKDDEERQAKAGLRASGVLRRIKRFANALAEGVPPAQRDTPGNAATLADWIYQCRRAGLYDLGRILYEKGGLRFDGLDEDLQLQVEEDYQICTRRSEKKEDKTKRKGKKSGQLELGLEVEEE